MYNGKAIQEVSENDKKQEKFLASDSTDMRLFQIIVENNLIKSIYIFVLVDQRYKLTEPNSIDIVLTSCQLMATPFQVKVVKVKFTDPYTVSVIIFDPYTLQ